MKRALLTEFLSSVSQRDMMLDGLQTADITGIIRLDILLFGKIVMPDSHLLDGPLLLDRLGPDGLKDLCGHRADHPTVEIRLRRATLKETIREYFVDSQGMKLRPLELRFLRDFEMERRLADHFSSGIRVSQRMSAEKAVAGAMKSVGVADDKLEAWQEGLRRWTSASDVDGLFGRWPTTSFPLIAVAAESRLPERALVTSLGRNAYTEVNRLLQEGDTRSSTLDKVLRSYFDGEEESEAIVDSRTIREWYHDCRQIAIARQHDSNVLTRPAAYRSLAPAIMGNSEQTSQTIAAGESQESKSVRRLVFVLGEMSPKEFCEVLDSTAIHRRAWLAKRDSGSLKRLITKSLEVLLPGEPKQDKTWYQQERIILPTASTVAGMVASGPTTAIATGLITLGLTSGGSHLADVLSQRGEVRALVRWAKSSGRTGPSR